MNKTKLMGVVFLLILFSSTLFALDGKVITVTGKVEYKDDGGIWKALSQGDNINPGTMVSTGFKSEATVQLGASILTLKPLTRMTLTELVEKEDVVDTELYLEVGNIKAEVSSFNNKRNGFTVKSPVATASVRGTEFEFGENLFVSNGSVSFESPMGQFRIAVAGDELSITGETISNPITVKLSKINSVGLSNLPSNEKITPISTNSLTRFNDPKDITAETPKPTDSNITEVLIKIE